MADVVHNVQQEYWHRPAQTTATAAVSPLRGQLTCEHCGSEFVMGSRFCHVCGGEREPLVGGSTSWLQVLEFGRVREALGLSTASLVAFIIGIGCVLAAIATGVVFTASTMLDWQAVQAWRIEWLLAATASFVAGILLNKSNPR